MVRWLRQVWVALSRSQTDVEVKINYSKVDLDLLSNIFGTEEARKQLLMTPAMEPISPEQILKDAQAMELMLKTYPWKIYEQALWRRTLTEIRASFGEATVERREVARNRAMTHLSDLHLPFELKAESDRIKKMQEMTRMAQQKI